MQPGEGAEGRKCLFNDLMKFVSKMANFTKSRGGLNFCEICGR